LRRAELSALKMSELKRRVAAAGVSAAARDDAEDSADPKAALIQLLLDASATVAAPLVHGRMRAFVYSSTGVHILVCTKLALN
jgi:hypothetical protein